MKPLTLGIDPCLHRDFPFSVSFLPPHHGIPSPTQSCAPIDRPLSSEEMGRGSFLIRLGALLNVHGYDFFRGEEPFRYGTNRRRPPPREDETLWPRRKAVSGGSTLRRPEAQPMVFCLVAFFSSRISTSFFNANWTPNHFFFSPSKSINFSNHLS